MREELSVNDNILNKIELWIQKEVVCWKQGWIKEVESKSNKNKIEIFNEYNKECVKTRDKLAMEHAIEYVEAVNVA